MSGPAFGTTMACRNRRGAPAMRSTRTRTRFASSSDSGLFSGNSGTKREHREVGVAVHEHVLDELLGRKAVDRVVGAAGPVREAGEDLLPVLAGGAAPAAGRVDHVGLDVEDELVAGDRARPPPRARMRPPGATRNCPPMLPSAANASFSVRNVVAAPHSDCRKARRSSPTRLACSPIRRSASALARATGSASGTGRNSPLDVGSTLTGSGPRKSLAMGHASVSQISKHSRLSSCARPGASCLPKVLITIRPMAREILVRTYRA